MNNLISDIKKNIEGEVTDDKKTLDVYSRDAGLFQVLPKLVVYPKGAEDIKKLVILVNEKNSHGASLSLTVRAAGTDMSGGPINESIVLDIMRHMNQIPHIYGNIAETEPGVYYRDFEKETLKKNLLLPSYPASRDICAMGGILANNSGGEKTLTYGKTENYIEELSVVLRDGNEYILKELSLEELEVKKKSSGLEGEIYRSMHALVVKNYDTIQSARPTVSKNSAGYALWSIYNKERGTLNLAKLFIGSQGTLGIITKAKIRLITPKKYSRLLVIFLKDTGILASLITHVLQYKPESFESYDDHTFRVAMRVLPGIIRQLGGNIISLGFRFIPELWMTLTGGIPKMILLAEFTGDTDEEAFVKATRVRASLAKFHLSTKVTTSQEDAKKFWTIRRESFNLLRHHVHGMRTAPFIDDIVVHPKELSVFLPRLYSILNEYNILYTVAGHVGDANFHIIPLMDMKKPEVKKIIMNLSHKIFDLVFEFKGSITGEHNDGLVRSPYLKKMFGENMYRLFEETKKIFDPDNIFNPGKKVGATEMYEFSHLIRE